MKVPEGLLCPPLEGGPKSVISRRGLNCKAEIPTYNEPVGLVTEVPEGNPSPELLNSLSSLSNSTLSLKGRGRVKNSRFTRKKAAFTLAEVLITLGIIGVVAAMTLPSLVGNYKKVQTVSQLQKVYTTLNQALKLSEAKYGPYEYWDVPELGDTVHDYYEKYWYPYFKILKTCNTYSECGYSSIFPWLLLNGTEYTLTFSKENLRIPFMLTDGTLVSISIAGGSGETFAQQTSIYVDLNGSKSPNTMGRDLFVFHRVKGKGILPNGYSSSSVDVNKNCSPTGTGTACAAKIISDGWQIKEDYPWK